MVDLALFSPEVEALVREYAADPRSCLLRVPRERAVPNVLDAARPVGPRATGLGALERELLRVHRCALAKLLRDACIIRLYDHPEARLRLIRHQTTDGRTHVPERGDWRARAELGLEDAHADGVDGDWLELLERCVATEGLGQATVQQLAAASMRLEPTDQARIYTGQALYHDGDVETACRIFRGVAETSASARLVASALTNLAAVDADRGRRDAAIEGYARATAADGEQVNASMFWFVNAALASDRLALERASDHVDRFIPPTAACVDDMCAAMRAQKAAGVLSLDGSARREVTAALDRSAATTRRIADALV